MLKGPCPAARVEWGFALLAPTTGPEPPRPTPSFTPRRSARSHVALELESALHANPHHPPRLHRLDAVRATLLSLGPDHAWSRYQQTLASTGQRLGDIKPTTLSAREGRKGCWR
ncbi:MAG: hypothetical protein U1G05_00340 [Kiritimatiellia bacterium]